MKYKTRSKTKPTSGNGVAVATSSSSSVRHDNDASHFICRRICGPSHQIAPSQLFLTHYCYDCELFECEAGAFVQ